MPALSPKCKQRSAPFKTSALESARRAGIAGAFAGLLDLAANRRNTVLIDHATALPAQGFKTRLSGHYDLTGLILFGSRARGEHYPQSDADIAVLLRGHRRNSREFMETKLAMADIAFDVMLDTGIRIQPLPVWEDEWQHPESYSNPRLLENINRDGIRL